MHVMHAQKMPQTVGSAMKVVLPYMEQNYFSRFFQLYL